MMVNLNKILVKDDEQNSPDSLIRMYIKEEKYPMLLDALRTHNVEFHEANDERTGWKICTLTSYAIEIVNQLKVDVNADI